MIISLHVRSRVVSLLILVVTGNQTSCEILVEGFIICSNSYMGVRPLCLVFLNLH